MINALITIQYMTSIPPQDCCTSNVAVVGVGITAYSIPEILIGPKSNIFTGNTKENCCDRFRVVVGGR